MRKPAYGAIVTAYRESLGLSVQDFADKAGFPVDEIKGIETGQQEMNINHLETFYYAFGQGWIDYLGVCSAKNPALGPTARFPEIRIKLNELQSVKDELVERLDSMAQQICWQDILNDYAFGTSTQEAFYEVTQEIEELCARQYDFILERRDAEKLLETVSA